MQSQRRGEVSSPLCFRGQYQRAGKIGACHVFCDWHLSLCLIFPYFYYSFPLFFSSFRFDIMKRPMKPLFPKPHRYHIIDYRDNKDSVQLCKKSTCLITHSFTAANSCCPYGKVTTEHRIIHIIAKQIKRRIPQEDYQNSSNQTPAIETLHIP